MLESIETGWGLDLIMWFQSWRTEAVALLFLPFNFLVKEWFYFLLFPFLYWAVNKSFTRRFFFISFFSVWLNVFLKNLWMRPRPYQLPDSPVRPYFDYADSFGLPSGHSQNGTLLMAYPAVSQNKPWVVTGAIILSLLTALSRMIHGVHFPQDVITGLIIGWVLVLLFHGLERQILTLLKRISDGWKITGSLLLGLLLVLIYLLLPVDSRGIDEMITAAAVLSGGLIGMVLDDCLLHFNEKGSWKMRILRVITGLVGAGILYVLLKLGESTLMKALDNPELLSWMLRYIRYGLLGIWVTFGGPWIFVRLKMAV